MAPQPGPNVPHCLSGLQFPLFCSPLPTQSLEQITDKNCLVTLVTEREFGIYSIYVLPSLSPPCDILGGSKVSDNPVNRPLRDPYHCCDLPRCAPRMPSYIAKHQTMIGNKSPLSHFSKTARKGLDNRHFVC
jgi:hypothetical protein